MRDEARDYIIGYFIVMAAALSLVWGLIFIATAGHPSKALVIAVAIYSGVLMLFSAIAYSVGE